MPADMFSSDDCMLIGSVDVAGYIASYIRYFSSITCSACSISITGISSTRGEHR